MMNIDIAYRPNYTGQTAWKQSEFNLCLPAGDCKSVSANSLGCLLTGCVLTTMSLIGLALLGWSAFDFDTNG